MIKLRFLRLFVCITLLFSCSKDRIDNIPKKTDNGIRTDELSAKHSELSWPNASPPDSPGIIGLNINGTPYHRVEVSKGKWIWEEDFEATKIIQDDNNRRRELMRLLQSRVLTKKEMDEVTSRGRDLNIYNGEPFNEAEKQRELNEALLQQFRLRQLEKDSGAPSAAGANEDL